MSEPCDRCGIPHLVSVRIPGHDDIEAVICLACGHVQPPRLHHPAHPAPEK